MRKTDIVKDFYTLKYISSDFPTPYMNSRAMTHCVSKAYAFFNFCHLRVLPNITLKDIVPQNSKCFISKELKRDCYISTCIIDP